MEDDRFRVRSPIKTFRDLEVYQKTIQLSCEIIRLDFLTENEINELKLISEKIPLLIAESYGDRYDSKELACKKITESVELITNIITKLDILKERFLENINSKDILEKLLTKYIYQKRKVLNLRRAWERVFENNNGESGKFSSDKDNRNR